MPTSRMLACLVVVGLIASGLPGQTPSNGTSAEPTNAAVNGSNPAEPPTSSTSAGQDHAAVPTPLEKVTVRDSKQSEAQLNSLSENLNRKIEPPSIEKGGMRRKKFRSRDVDVGAQRHDELLKADEKYKNKKPLVKIDLMRMAF